MLALARHADTETRKPLNIKELLPSAATRQEYERWLSANGSGEVKRVIAKNHSSLLSNEDVGGGVSSFLKSAARMRDDEEDFEEDAKMFWVL